MRKIKEVIVVEGRYDQNTLAQVVDLRMKSQRGADPVEELKLLLARLGAARK